MFGSPKSLRHEHRLIVEEIENGKPIEPRHAQPASIDQDGFTSCITGEDRAAFAKTRFFGITVNRSLDWGGWRLQEKSQPLLRGFDGPSFGRSFDLFYNAHLTGCVYLYASPLSQSFFSGGEALKKPVDLKVRVDVEHTQFYSYHQLRDLLRALTFSVAS